MPVAVEETCTQTSPSREGERRPWAQCWMPSNKTPNIVPRASSRVIFTVTFQCNYQGEFVVF